MRRELRRPDSGLDWLVGELDRGLRAVNGFGAGSGRANPAAAVPDTTLRPEEIGHSAGLLRVDHAGEVAAQALYHGQSLAAREPRVRQAMERAAVEENDHLAWCRERLDELGARPSRLDPLWYAGSFAIGFAAGLAGDRVSLGFVAETERQVVEHLEGHLESLPPADRRSRAILEQMKDDEREHASSAERRGALPLPRPVRSLMRAVARVMTTSAYRF